MVTNRLKWLLQLVLCCGLFVELCQSQGLSVIGPKLIRPFTPYTVAFANSLSRDARLEVVLEGPTDSVSVLNRAARLAVTRRTGKSHTFEVGEIPNGEYRLSIKSLSADFGFNEEIDLIYDGKTESLFVQLDKPVYKPGDMLRFRVVVVDVNTRPVTNLKSVQVKLADKDGNSIMEWPFGRLYNGVFETSFQLASSPVLGNWTLTALAGSSKVKKQFELREYILPKYYIKVYPTEVLLASKKQIKLAVETAYTFGRPLDGTLTVDLFLEDIYQRNPDHSVTKRIEGRTSVEFDLKKEVEVEEDSIFANVWARVSVMETFTNKTETIMRSIPVYKNPYTITVIKSEPMFRARMSYNMQLEIKDHNEVPAKGGTTASITIMYDGGNFDEISMVGEVDAKGMVPLELTPPTGATTLHMRVIYDSFEYDQFEEIYAAQSRSNQFITVTLNLKKYKVRPNKEVLFEVSCTERISHFSYILVARGSIVDSGNVNVFNKQKTSFRYRLLPQLAPKAKLIVSYTNKEFLIFDELDLDFDVFNNDFEFSLDHEVGNDYHPGQDIYVDLKAANDSYIAFHAIDQSVLHLGRDGHVFSRDDVLEDLSQYGATEANEFDPFHTMGLFLRTTAQVDFPYARQQLSRFGGSVFGKRVEKAIHIRTVFPETWLWRNYTMDGRNSKMTIASVVPDTVTSWTVTGFALSPTYGLGIMQETREFTVNQPFYIIANLPYSIKRDEVAVIHVTVFNFLGNTLTTDVTLFNKNDEIEFVEKSSDDPTRRTKAIIVPGNNGKPISFLIKAKKLGEIAIKIQAVNPLKTDSVEHMLRVIPESHMHEVNEARFIDLPKNTVQNFQIQVNIPREIDEGSARIKFTLDPDILGTAIKNLESLIRLPTGCGEQNMMRFVPNIVVLDYLSETGTIRDDIKEKAIGYLKSGYQNQMKYKLSDGSFGIWASSRGGTFLTAFVAKSLKIADKYMSVDIDVVNKAFAWLAGKQQPDGRFTEVGDVAHADMQGGLRSTSYALTAYVLAAFLETKSIAQTHSDVVRRSANYLMSNLDNMNNVYDLALTTYALSLQSPTNSQKFFDKLVESSTYDSTNKVRSWSYKSLGVEIAGYALLSYVQREQILDATPIMRWLTSQRYDLGGFPGTQDTYVGLKALAKFAAKASAHRNDYRVTVRPKKEKLLTFDVDKKVLSIQELDLDSSSRSIDVEVSGIGKGVFQVAYQYYQNILKEKSSFDLSVNLMNTTTYYRQQLHVCVKFNPKEAYQYSNMVLVEVFFPSGIVADDDAVQDLSSNRAIQKTELRFGGTSLVVYYTRLGVQKNCFTVTAERRFKVALHRPTYVVVYDYYDNKQSDRFAIQSYEGKVMQLCDVCEDEDCVTLACPPSTASG
uniref:TEP1-F n=1 Tax=Culex pipiens TaxID=7175 RepID=A0A8D8DI20_CULPI